jgi:SNF2 family DNA or RNA helicase
VFVLNCYDFQEYLKANPDDSDDSQDDEMAHVGNGFHLYHALYDKLYSHQREGILFLWKLYKQKRGGVLGDDMGFVFICYYSLRHFLYS